MKYATLAAMLIILVLAATGAWAQCTTECTQCPQPCPTQCPQPCPQPCPTQCPAQCPASVPASIGAGPQADLEGVQCPDFDPAYMSKVYDQNATIIAVTNYGMQRAGDKNLRNISAEINERLVSANNKLETLYAGCGCLTSDMTKANTIIADLNKECGTCFDVTYAKTLSALVKQLQAADGLVCARSANSQLVQYSRTMSAKEADWAMRLDRWVMDHGYQS